MNVLTLLAYASTIAATIGVLGWCYRLRGRVVHWRARSVALAAGVLWGVVTGVIAHDTRLTQPAAWSPVTVLAIFAAWQAMVLREDSARQSGVFER